MKKYLKLILMYLRQIPNDVKSLLHQFMISYKIFNTSEYFSSE